MSIKDEYKVIPIPSGQTHDWLLNKHYAKRIPSISYAFGLYDSNNDLQGICTFGRTAFYEPSLICGEENKNIVYELNRLCVNDGQPPNALSYFVSSCIKLLPCPSILISYSDEAQGHLGHIYQATNWLYTGYGVGSINYITSIGRLSRSGMRNRETRKQEIPEIFSIESGSIKHRYVYFWGNKTQINAMKCKLKYPTLPYPKGDNKRYDASYQPEIQQVLFV